MHKQERNFKYYWEFIDVPVGILVLWTILVLAFQVNNYLPEIIYGILNWGLIIVVFGYVGFVLSKEGNKPKNCTKAGAYAGAISGLIGAIAAIIAFHVSPGIFNEALQQMIQAGMDTQSANTFLSIGLYMGIITGPLFNAFIGALIAWISGLIFRKKK